MTGQKSLNFLHRFSFFLATQEHSLVFPLLSSKVSGSSQPLAAKVGAGVVGAKVGAGVVGAEVGAGVGTKVGAGVGLTGAPEKSTRIEDASTSPS